MAISVHRPEHLWCELNRREPSVLNHLEGFWKEEWSLMPCSEFSNRIKCFGRLSTVSLAKGGRRVPRATRVDIQRFKFTSLVAVCVALFSDFWFLNDFSFIFHHFLCYYSTVHYFLFLCCVFMFKILQPR